MARPIQHSAVFPHPVDTVVGALTDDAYLNARLAELGGKDAALVSHEGDRIVLRQGVPVEFLPSVVRRFTGDDLILDRTETWNGPHADVAVDVRGLPGSITGTQQVVPDGEGSRLTVDASTTVPVPMVGGKIEGVVAEQVGELLRWEADFLTRWLAG
ncbi:DUF2505 domain-containing protein [Actinomycetospora termitidis]|uniref:DUF2505 domain-containing protein n=1 Tax=Actinomycetospora termitidis TaxID=3053470 RepID=A0ABT7M3M1_9PSEU|nr:DUF2505 domain-containing protein [Actinomycetospora sp. Odt1-22]MDL5155272.1 DUF2505 domain-containing protein [Actinomycetospora sp. Odt1-22]